MYKSIFKDIAGRQNGVFYFTDEDIAIGMGLRSPNVVYVLKIPYEENEIVVYNTTGTHYVGKIKVRLPKQVQDNEFKITTRSHWKTLFRPKAKRFIIESKSENLIYFLEQNSFLKDLSETADRDKFHPVITGVNKENEYLLEMNYHLEFSDWTDPIEPTIHLFKSLIDEFLELNGNLSLSNYKTFHYNKD